MARTVEELMVYQKAMTAEHEMSALLRSRRFRDDGDIGFQLRKGSSRIPSDIAEGFEQKTDRHFAKYLYDAKGAAREIRAQLVLAVGRRLVSEDDARSHSTRYEEIGRMLAGLIRKLERDNSDNRRRPKD